MPQRDDIERRLQATYRTKIQTPTRSFLDRLRLFGQEGLFLIGTRILSGTISAQLAGTAFRRYRPKALCDAIHALVLEQFKQGSTAEIEGQRDRYPCDGSVSAAGR